MAVLSLQSCMKKSDGSGAQEDFSSSTALHTANSKPKSAHDEA
jgi:hypothetical protein